MALDRFRSRLSGSRRLIGISDSVSADSHRPPVFKLDEGQFRHFSSPLGSQEHEADLYGDYDSDRDHHDLPNYKRSL